MRALYAGLLGLVVGLGPAAEVVAQSRVLGRGAASPGAAAPAARVTAPQGSVGVAGAAPPPRVVAPIVVPVPRPAPGSATPTQVFIQGAPNVAGAGARPGMLGGAASAPANVEELRIRTDGPGGSGETRVFVQEKSTAGRSAGPGMVGGAASVPSFAREFRVIVEEDRGPGTPVVTRETQIFLERGDLELPIIILE